MILAFEENEDKSNGIDDRIKVLRLKEGADYDVQINGTGYGHMNYTIGFMDENGDYNDLRKFRNIKITKKTEIDTVATILPPLFITFVVEMFFGDGSPKLLFIHNIVLISYGIFDYTFLINDFSWKSKLFYAAFYVGIFWLLLAIL